VSTVDILLLIIFWLSAFVLGIEVNNGGRRMMYPDGVAPVMFVVIMFAVYVMAWWVRSQFV